MPPSTFDASRRYDRQLRLWGEEGQTSIGATSVCVLGSDSLATEILKSLVLAGVHSFHIVDDARVIPPDVGQNFFLHTSDMDRPRCQATLEKLTELNPSVSGSFSDQSATALAQEDLEKLAGFSVVVAANQSEDVETQFARVLYPLGVPFVCIRTYGLLGTIKICIREHTIANSHEENPRPDLRLDVPFPRLLEMVHETILEESTIEQLRHTPYILLHFKALEAFRKGRQDPEAFPENYCDRQEIQRLLRDFRRAGEDGGSKDSENFDEARSAVTRAFQRTTTFQISSSVKSILADAQTSTSTQPFWLICEALRRFVATNGGLLPLRGTLPDMTSDSSRYTRLAQIFHEKALQDAQEVLRLTRIVEKERGVGDVISDEMCYRFCKNADRIGVQRGEILDFDKEIESIVEMVREQEPMEEKKVENTTWMLLMRAVGRFRKEKGRFPGTNGVPVSIDAMDLKRRVEVMVKEVLKNDSDLPSVLRHISDSAISEMCRFGAAELHVISSYIGGIAAQEIIKLATNQYVPLDNTFIFNGHTQESNTFKL